MKPSPVSRSENEGRYSLKDITIISEMLWSPTFIDWSTQFLLQSPNLTNLTLTFDHDDRPWRPDLKGHGPQSWLANFRAVVVPTLNSFTCWSQINLGEDPIHAVYEAVAHFLSRHPTLETLVIRRCHVPNTIFSDLVQLDGPILPSLKKLQAHPALIRWILQEKKGLFDSLQDIEMDVTAHSGPLDVYDIVDQCLVSLLQHGLNRPDVQLHFTFPDIGHPCDWFLSHIAAAERRVHLLSVDDARGARGALIERFIGTRSVKVASDLDGLQKFPLPEQWPQAEILARWLGLFPDVEDIYVRAIKWSIPNVRVEMVAVDQAFNFRSNCPQAKKVMMGHIPLVETYSS